MTKKYIIKKEKIDWIETFSIYFIVFTIINIPMLILFGQYAYDTLTYDHYFSLSLLQIIFLNSILLFLLLYYEGVGYKKIEEEVELIKVKKNE